MTNAQAYSVAKRMVQEALARRGINIVDERKLRFDKDIKVMFALIDGKWQALLQATSASAE